MAKKSLSPELELLIEVFRDARDQLLNTIIFSGGVGTKVYYNTILLQLEKQLKRMEKQSAYYVQSEIPKEYRKSLDELYAYFQKNNLQMSPPQTFAQTHNDAVYAIGKEMQHHIGQGLSQVGRQVERYLDDARDDALRQAGLKAAGQKTVSGSTVQDMRKNLIDRLQQEGFMTVQYGEGKGAYQVAVEDYAAMVARSTTREAGNIARENQLIENGYDLVKITEHYPTCECCSKYQGRVYSLTGKDTRFPDIHDTAWKSGYRNIHPNCRHSAVPWIEELRTDEEVKKAIEFSNTPFVDERSEEEKGLYSKQQTENRQMRQDRYQYERYKMRLGDDAPKSFHAFRKMKKAGGNKWGVLEAKYKGMGYYEKAVLNEPTITKTVTETANEVGMTVEALEHRIKSKESYLRKIEANYTPNGNQYEVKDILRYTYTAPQNELANKTLESIDKLAEKGYNTSEIKNYWLKDDNPYSGINTVVKAPKGQNFEIQYHTAESFTLKNGAMHKLYEKQRLISDVTSPEYLALQDEMFSLSDTLVVPNSIEKVRNKS